MVDMTQIQTKSARKLKVRTAIKAGGIEVHNHSRLMLAVAR